MHCARVMRCDAVYFGINTIRATVFHPENRGSMSSRGGIYLQTCSAPHFRTARFRDHSCGLFSLAVFLRTFLP